MQQSMQIEIIKELLDHLDNKRTADAGRIVVNPTSTYTDPALAEREWDAFFKNHPQVLGMSGELPKPGSYLTMNDFGVPILATRDEHGTFHAFVNACRHRGAELTTEPHGDKNRFTCPFHGWTFANDGRLLGVRQSDQFGKLDKNCNGLIELPSEEKYGLLFVHPQVGGTLDVDALLEPAKSIGGDLFDVIRIDADRIAFVVGDVTGKGVPAANGKPAGDLYVEVQIVPPKEVNELTASLLKEIANAIDNPRARIGHLRA